MSVWIWASVGVGATLLLAVLGLGAVLWWRNRKEDARALVGFVPDCIVLAGRLLRDPRVRLRQKILLVLLIAYLANPLDLLPGSAIDDAILAALVLRLVLRGNASLVAKLWPGPASSRDVLLRLSGRPQ